MPTGWGRGQNFIWILKSIRQIHRGNAHHWLIKHESPDATPGSEKKKKITKMLIAGSWEIIPWEGSLYSCPIFDVLSLRVSVRAQRLWSFDLSSQAGHRSNNSYKPSEKINMNTISPRRVLPYSNIIWSLWPFRYCNLLIAMKISMYFTFYVLCGDHT